MGLFNFFEFILEKNDEVTFPFFYSSAFKEKLDKIDSPISDGLLDMKYVPFKYSMITIGSNSNDSISIVPSNRLVSQYPNFRPDLMQHFRPRIGDVMWSNGSIEMKIGRFIKKVFENEFSDSEIEKFVNKWKSLDSDNKFDILSGYEILNGYDSNKYHASDNVNPLSNSCMNDSFDLIEFYEYCPSVRLLVLLDDDKRILGRALVWKDYKDRFIMDRVYYIYDKDYYKFTSYAVKNDWYYKKKNISGESTFMKGDTEVSLNTKVKVVNVFEWEKKGSPFPYMDTFYYAQCEWAINNEPEDGRYFKLTDTDGSFFGESAMIDVHGNEIGNEEDYISSDEQGGLIYVDDAVHLSYNGGSSYPLYSFSDWVELSYLKDTRNGFVKSLVDNNWYKEKDCVWSDIENTWLYRPDAIYNKKDWVHLDNFNPGRNNI